MKTRHKSDSLEQRCAERYMLKKLGLSHRLQQPALDFGVQVKLDGFDEKRRILCEVYAHIGPLKPGQVHKIASDILKMLFVEKKLGSRWHKIYCFANEVPQQLRRSGKSWLAHAAIQFHVEFQAVRLSERKIALLRKVQRRQAKSINPTAAG